MFYLREHNLLLRKTVLIAQIADRDEAVAFAQKRMEKLKNENPVVSMLSMDDDPKKVYDFDEMINVIREAKDEVERICEEGGKEAATVQISMDNGNGTIKVYD